MATCLVVETLFASCCICPQNSLDCEACALALVGLEGLCLRGCGCSPVLTLAVNPQFFPSADTFQKALRDEEKRRKKEEKRKEIRKGPRISRSQSEL